MQNEYWDPEINRGVCRDCKNLIKDRSVFSITEKGRCKFKSGHKIWSNTSCGHLHSYCDGYQKMVPKFIKYWESKLNE